MKRFRNVSPARRILFAGIALLLVAMLSLRLLGVAGFNGTGVKEMDWDSDGTVSRSEILRGYSTVVVHETTNGNRTCRSYGRIGRGERAQALRVDCRVELAPATP